MYNNFLLTPEMFSISLPQLYFSVSTKEFRDHYVVHHLRAAKAAFLFEPWCTRQGEFKKPLVEMTLDTLPIIFHAGDKAPHGRSQGILDTFLPRKRDTRNGWPRSVSRTALLTLTMILFT